MRSLIDSLNELVLGRRCHGCGRASGVWCDECAATIGTASWLRPRSPCLAPVLAVSEYDHAVRAAILALKDGRSHTLARPLGRHLAEAVFGVEQLLRGDVSIVPVPSSPQRVRARGIDHAKSLALALARELRAHHFDATVRQLLGLVDPVGARADQGHLTASQRMANMAGSMHAQVSRDARSGRRARRTLIVVDDILTTGSTMTEAMRALAADAGLPASFGLVLASGAPRADQRLLR